MSHIRASLLHEEWVTQVKKNVSQEQNAISPYDDQDNQESALLNNTEGEFTNLDDADDNF